MREILTPIDYGKITIKLRNIMDKDNISIYKMSQATGLKYNTIKSYYDNTNLTRYDSDVLAKMCYALNCELSDILEYIPNKTP